MIKTDLSGFSCHNALRLVWTVCPISRPNGLRIGPPVLHAPSCIVTTNPAKTDLNPFCKIFDKIHVSKQRCSNMASDCLAAVLPANEMPGLKLFVKADTCDDLVSEHKSWLQVGLKINLSLSSCDILHHNSSGYQAIGFWVYNGACV